jgi:sterol desaturase/sphingolipid hydroxylase (fatty acid hydroxylase superfamily)
MDITTYLLEHGVCTLWGGLFSLLLLRYVIIGGVAWFLFYVFWREENSSRKIQQRWPSAQDYVREISYSVITFCIFAAVATVVFATPLGEYTQLYRDVDDHGWAYFTASVIAIILIHDAYFYFVHRAMHHPSIYKLVHLTHHRSVNPTPWAAFAFHPIEAVVEASIIFPVAFLFPVHPGAIITWLLFMTIYNVYGHLGWEPLPRGTESHFIGKWFNTSASHNQHHQLARSNYGLYFTWWDRLFNTLHPDYNETFLAHGR